MDTLEYILNKYNLIPVTKGGPTEIPNAGRDTMAELFGELGFTRGAEIGVEQGLYSEVLLKANPNLKLYCVDMWTAYPGYRDHVDQNRLDTFLNNTKERLAGYDVIYLKKMSMDALADVEDGSLDFVYIDANHELPWVLDDTYHWEKKVRVGGIISGHDYYESKRTYTKCHVKYAIDCYTRAFRIIPWFIWGAQAKIPGTIRDSSRSWMWVKKPIIYGEYMREAKP